MNGIQMIAAHYGRAPQNNQAIQECAELIHILTEINRKGLGDAEWRCLDLAEEIADVEIMIDQLKYLYGLGRMVKRNRRGKIARQLARIKGSE